MKYIGDLHLTESNKEMILNGRHRTHTKSFHHRIREGESHYVDDQQFLGIDPFDHSKFKEIYLPKRVNNKKKET